MPTAHDLSMLDGDELTARLGESRRELFNLRSQLATGQLDNPAPHRAGASRGGADADRAAGARSEAEGAYVGPTAAEHEAARANLAAEDAEREERAAAKAAAAEAESEAEGVLHDHDHDEPDDKEIDDEEEEA